MPPVVALFPTCLADTFYAEAVADTVRLLRHLGVEVQYPAGQTCCGQPAYNSGYTVEAERAARHTASLFTDPTYVVLPSGSCTAMLRTGFPKLLGPAAGELASRTYELSQFIVQILGITELGTGLTGLRVAYHHGCHALRGLGVESEPLSLLRGAGATLVPWESDQECCGFGGLFSVKVPEVSGAMADRKLDTLPPADFVTSTDGGCLMQLAGRAQTRQISVPFRHLASVLWEATQPDRPKSESASLKSALKSTSA